MATISARAVDPAIQKIWDDMRAFMGSTYSTCNATCTQDTTGTTDTINANDPKGNSFNYSQRVQGVTVSVSPIGASLGPGEKQQFLATATNPDGSPVATPAFVWSLSSISPGTIDQTGQYTAPVIITA